MDDIVDWRGTPNHMLWSAAAAGDVAEVQRVLEEHKGASVDCQDPVEGKTPLHLAVVLGNKRLYQFLVTHGADLDADDRAGETPLHVAARAGRTDLVLSLLRRGCNANARTKVGDTPLHNAARNGWVVACRYLVENGAIVSSVNDAGDAPLHATARGPRRGYKSGHREVAAYLITEANANPNKPNSRHQLPHEVAREAGRPKLAESLTASLDSEEWYRVGSLRRGLALVVVNTLYGDKALKWGNENAKHITETLRGLDYKVMPKWAPLVNPSREDILSALAKVAKADWNHLDSFVFYYYGLAPDCHNIACPTRQLVTLAELLDAVGWQKARTMRGKPKVFILDTCPIVKAPLVLFSNKKKPVVDTVEVDDWEAKKRRYKEEDERKQRYTQRDSYIAWCHAPEHVSQPAHTRRPGEPGMSRFSWHLTRGLRRYTRTLDITKVMSRLRRDMAMDSAKQTTGAKGQVLLLRSLLGKDGEKKVFLRPGAPEKARDGHSDEESDDADDKLPGRHGMLSVEEQKEVAAQMRAERSRAKAMAGKKPQNRFKNFFKRKPKTAADQALARKIKSQKALLKAQQQKEKATAKGGVGLLSKLSFSRSKGKKKRVRPK